MIDLYTFGTPNGVKASIMLEEVGLPYRAHTVNILADEQFDPEFLKISPNNKIPAIVDSDGPDGEPISLFESGAILFYLADKTRPADAGGCARALASDGVADVPDGGRRPDVRPGQPLPALRQGGGALRHRALHHRGASALRRDGPQAQRSTISSRATIPSPTSPASAGSGRWEWHGIDWADYPNLHRWLRDHRGEARGAAGAQGSAIGGRGWPTRSLIRRCGGCRRRSPRPGRGRK